MSSVIDPSQQDEGMMIAAGVSEELDGMKEMYYALPDLLSKVGQHAAWCGCCVQWRRRASVAVHGNLQPGNHIPLPITNVSALHHSMYAASLQQALPPFHPTLCHSSQVVQLEMDRIPRGLAHSLSQHLWSIVYMPQAGSWTVLLWAC